jgi:hypothetical protein
MPAVKKTIVAFVATLAFAAIAASTASAGWFVEGQELASGSASALATTAKVDENYVLKFSSVTVTCSGGTLNSVKPEIAAPNKITASSLVFNECSASGGECSLARTTIGTLPVTTELTTEGTVQADKGTLKPNTGKVLATLQFTGSKCAFAEEVVPVRGSVAVHLPTGAEDNETQLISANATAASKELEVGSSVASLTGSILSELASHEEWKWVQPGAPVIRVIRTSTEGGGGARTKECRFPTTNKRCVIRVEIQANPGARKFEITADEHRGSAEFRFVSPAANIGTETECNIGVQIGPALNSSCALELEYMGIANPARKQFLGAYRSEIKEVGGAGRAAGRVLLAAS